MKGLSKQEHADALKALLPEVAGDDLETLDRSTLDRWASCPWAASAIESGRVKTVGIAAEAGEAIHNALAIVTRGWVENGHQYERSWEASDGLRQDLECELRRSRPDLQPEVLKGMMPSVWAWAKFLVGINPGNILGFDGGHDIGRSAQLAYDMPDLGARVTSELDLLTACRESTELIDWYDYKTGHKKHDVDIADEFQFQMHAMLILKHYPEVNAARLRVWDTRINRQTYLVVFPRSRFHDYEWRVRSAVETRKQHRDNPPTWPTTEKCSICPAAVLCPVADEPFADLAADPPGFVKKMVAVGARFDAMQELASKWVDEHKQDIQCGGVFFGRNAPKSERKPAAKLYELKGKSNGDSDSE